MIEIIDGHDTRKHALSLEDALMKDADKLWRFSRHGVATIGGWFGSRQRTRWRCWRILSAVDADRYGQGAAEALIARATAGLDDDLMQLRETSDDGLGLTENA